MRKIMVNKDKITKFNHESHMDFPKVSKHSAGCTRQPEKLPASCHMLSQRLSHACLSSDDIICKTAL